MEQQQETSSGPTASSGQFGRLGGIIAASLTPLHRDGRIDLGRMQTHFDWLFQQGCSFVSPFGSTGEGPSFSVGEKREALEVLAAAGVPMARLVPAAMSAAVDDTVATIRAAARLGCRAVLIVPPYYYGSASQEGIAAFFHGCAAQLGGRFPIDVVLYHIPAMSRIPFGVSLIEALLRDFAGQIVGIKDSTGDREHTLMLVRTFPHLRVFTGDDRVLPALLEAGGAGMIGGMPNVVAGDLCALYKNPKGPGAEAIIERAGLRIAAVDAHGGVQALRALLAEAYGDKSWAIPKAPLTALEDDRYARLRAAFAETQFDFAVSISA